MNFFKGFFYFLVTIAILAMLAVIGLILWGVMLVGPIILCVGLVVVLLMAAVKEMFESSPKK